ncbi:Lipase A [Lachnellula hyalina]|uniref:Lipase A n=1 Tax=Lachnellula hyalina TaxID=1316788 RepID=A0A8H8TUY9_9HELO|nr:Lipase A [Lachnellula hyalina]TVY22782.1 Lipase A [Lachnellula hyalina]
MPSPFPKPGLRVFTLLLLHFTYMTHATPLQYNNALRILHRQNPTPPDLDPFYSTPPGLNVSSPGDILRYRPVPYPIAAFNTTVLNLAAAFHIQYRTTDSLGNPEAAMTTLLIPLNADPAKLLSYQIAEDSAFQSCAPSFALQKMSASNVTSSIELAFIEAALNKGWYVVTPDFEGPKSAYVAGPQAGHAVLDSLRAVMQSTAFSNITEEPRTALWGYSGGAFASNWALELQASYAPELNLVGAATGGTINNIAGAFSAINNGILAGLIPTSFMGLAAAYPDFSEALEEELVPETAATFKTVLTECSSGDSSAFTEQDMLLYFKTGAAFLNTSIVQSTLDKVNIGKHVPITPLYIYKSINDEISPISDTDVFVDFYCEGGADVEYRRDELSGHITLAITGAGEALAWLEERMAGVAVQSGCRTTSVVSTLLDPVGVLALGDIVVGALLGYLAGMLESLK